MRGGGKLEPAGKTAEDAGGSTRNKEGWCSAQKGVEEYRRRDARAVK